MHNIGINEVVLNEIIMLAKKYNLKNVVLFGSRSRNDYKKTSDIDLAVSGGDVIRFIIDVQEETSTLLTFDVVNLDGAVQSELKDEIKNEGITIYEKI